MKSGAEASSERVRAALALPARAGLYQALVESEHGLSSDDLARKAGLHPNTVRWHLRRLEEAGLVSSEREQGRRGRPRLSFRARPVADQAAEFRLLAGALTKALGALPDGAERAELAGFELGRSLMREPADAEEAASRLYDLALTFQERSQSTEAGLLADFEAAASDLAEMVGGVTIADDDDERLVFGADGRFSGEVIPEEDAGRWRQLTRPEEIVEFYDPTDVFGDLAESLGEAYPSVAPELGGGDDD